MSIIRHLRVSFIFIQKEVNYMIEPISPQLLYQVIKNRPIPHSILASVYGSPSVNIQPPQEKKSVPKSSLDHRGQHIDIKL